MEQKTSDDVLKEHVASLPPELRGILAEWEWDAKVREIAGEYGLSDEQSHQLETEAGLALIGLTRVDELKSTLVSEMRLAPGIAEGIDNAFFERVLDPIMSVAEKRGVHFGGGAGEVAAENTSEPERKLLDENGYVVTTHRFIWPGGQVSMDEVRRAVDFTHYEWRLGLMVSGIGLAIVTFTDSSLWQFIGLLALFVGGPLVCFKLVDRSLVVSTTSDGIHLEFKKNKELRAKVQRAVNESAKMARTSRAHTLRAELDAIPDL